MQTSSPRPHLLDRFPHLRSRSPEEARALIGQIFSPHHLAMRGKEMMLNLHHNRIRLSQLGLNVLTYGVPVEIDQRERGDFYMLMLPLKGHAVAECGGRLGKVDKGCMGVLYPRQATRMQWSGDCEMILLEVPRQTFEEAVGTLQVQGRNINVSLPRTSQAVGAWWQSVLDMTHSLHHYGDQWLSQPRMQLAMEEFLLAGLHPLFSDQSVTPFQGAVLSANSQRAQSARC